MELTKSEQSIIDHALTGSTENVYRNRYNTDPNDIELRSLVAKGAMVEGRVTEGGTSQTFHVTEDGAKAVGLYLPDSTEAEVARLQKALREISTWRERAWAHDDDMQGEGHRREFYGDDIADIEQYAASVLSR